MIRCFQLEILNQNILLWSKLNSLNSSSEPLLAPDGRHQSSELTSELTSEAARG